MAKANVKRVAVLQPAMPFYRLDFFDRLDAAFPKRLTVYASNRDVDSLTLPNARPWQVSLPAIRSPVPGLQWQPGALSIPIHRGDVLVVCGEPRILSSLLLLVRARLLGASTIWWGHYWSGTTRPWRFKLRMLLLRLADAVLFYTDDEVALYRAGIGSGDARLVSAINNGIDLAPIRSLRIAYRAKQRPPSLMFIGRLTPKAQLDLLLEALRNPVLDGVRLVVIGTGAEERRLQTLAETLGLAERIEWHGALMNEAQIARLMNRCRLFVYPGSVGLSLIHAMSYGLPAVVHDDRWTHMPEIAAFTEGLTGYSFPAGDAAALARTLAAALADCEALDSASAEALIRVETTFNTSSMADRAIQAITSIVEERNRRGAMTKS